MDRILIQTLSKTPREYPLDKERIVIGSDPGNDIVLAGELGVSANHAEVLKGPGGYCVVDLDSSAGTLVNGEKVTEKALFNGDKIKIGVYTLVVFCGCEAEAQPAGPGPAGAPCDAESTMILQRKEEAQPAGPGRAGAPWDGEATMILQRKEEAPENAGLAPAPAAAAAVPGAAGVIWAAPKDEGGPAAAPAAPAGGFLDRYNITSILKVPKKSKASPAGGTAAQELEEGVIEIEIPETGLWTKQRLTTAAVLAGSAGCLIAVLAFLISADFRASLLPSTTIVFRVSPDDARVSVNGIEMPGQGSGVLRNLPAGTFSVKITHPSYPAANTAEITTGLFKRAVRVNSGPGGISAK